MIYSLGIWCYYKAAMICVFFSLCTASANKNELPVYIGVGFDDPCGSCPAQVIL